jgi:hypothetical protein
MVRLFRLLINKKKAEPGIDAIAIVNEPAILENFIKLSKESPEPFLFSIDSDKQIITGPILIPNKPVYRKDFNGQGEANIIMDTETIKFISQQYLKQKKNNNVTLEHEVTTTELFMIESWIIEDSKKDKSAIFGKEYPIGTWMGSFKVISPEIWQEIKDGVFNGFSIEAYDAFEWEEILLQSAEENMNKSLDELDETIELLFKTLKEKTVYF